MGSPLIPYMVQDRRLEMEVMLMSVVVALTGHTDPASVDMPT